MVAKGSKKMFVNRIHHQSFKQEEEEEEKGKEEEEERYKERIYFWSIINLKP